MVVADCGISVNILPSPLFIDGNQPGRSIIWLVFETHCILANEKNLVTYTDDEE